ncbi:hypothetical protein [Arundinibacter roseus]|uniref:UPF0323 domain-containing protein n=1 Tax=Arundinibacter roseus TaxID=2070510 RepID=A0A4R4K8M4_9BACT|nr:hypothetical protein [Arundinibacter roseus]TDB63988.1 hypothetical protein EZE20_13670 [Arundinibacter roseus]
MTPTRKGHFIRKAKDITISSTLAFAILASGMMLPGCGSNESNEADYSYEETTYTKGIRSHIKEVKPGEFKITDEETVEIDKAEAIVTYLDGRTETISPAAAKKLIDEEIAAQKDSTQSSSRHHSGYHRSGLSSMLLYGGMGYMLGRTMNNGYMNSFRDRNPNGSAFYSNPGAYQKSQSAYSDVNASRTTRTVTTRPTGGRSGFFGSRSSAKGGG